MKDVIELHGGKFDGLRFTPKDLEDLQEMRQLLGHYADRVEELETLNEELATTVKEIAHHKRSNWATIHASGTLARLELEE